MASSGTLAPELAAAYEECRRIHATHGRTYYLATRMLPRDPRPDVWRLYAFARLADDLLAPPGALAMWAVVRAARRRPGRPAANR